MTEIQEELKERLTSGMKETIIREYTLYPKNNIKIIVTIEETMFSFKLINRETSEEFVIGSPNMAGSLMENLAYALNQLKNK